MMLIASWRDLLSRSNQSAQQWLVQWWKLLHFGAVLLLLALSPSSYKRADRLVLARHVGLDLALVQSLTPDQESSHYQLARKPFRVDYLVHQDFAEFC